MFSELVAYSVVQPTVETMAVISRVQVLAPPLKFSNILYCTNLLLALRLTFPAQTLRIMWTRKYSARRGLNLLKKKLKLGVK